jgi:predicted dehydrogenase
VLISLATTEERRILPATSQRFFRRKYARPLRKALYFARAEGMRATLRKYRSKKIEQKIETAQHIIVARIANGDGRTVIGFTRHLGGARRFDPELVFESPVELRLDEITLNDVTLELLESYLPVPACVVTERLRTSIIEANPGLRAAPSEVLGEQVTTPRSADKSVHRNGRGAVGGGVFLLGFGGYVREQVAPHFRGQVVLAVDHKAELIAENLRPEFALCEMLEEALPQIAAADAPLVIIATYHSDHASNALRVLEANPRARIFIEKPMSVSLADAELLAARRAAGAWIDVGYNRRYASLVRVMRQKLRGVSGPVVFSALVKELKVPETHWYLWPTQGTRVTGNACHWIDLACHLIHADASELTLLNTGDTTSLSILFSDGSLATIVATDKGDDLRGVRELIEVRASGDTYVLDDFARLTHEGDGHRQRITRLRRDKGHAAMYQDLKRRWLSGEAPRYPQRDVMRVCEITWRASQMLQYGERQHRLEIAGAPSQ